MRKRFFVLLLVLLLLVPTMTACGGLLGVAISSALPDDDSDDWDIQDGVVIAYYGDNEIVTVPETWNGRAVTEIGEGAFCYSEPQKNMERVVLHDGIERIGKNAFQDCKTLCTVTIPEAVTIIEESTFSNCTSLETIYFHDNVTKIKTRAFEKCIELRELILPRNLEEVDEYAFYDVPLARIAMFDGVKQISGNAFACSKTPKDVYFHGTMAQWDAIDKNETWIYHWAWSSGCYNLFLHPDDGSCDCFVERP